MPELELNNIFGHGYREEDLKRFQKAGFEFRSGESYYAGAQQLYFIDFQDHPCLELIAVSDDQTYRDFVPPGMIPYAPGLNLGIPEGDQEALGRFQERFQDRGPYLLHENYEGGQEAHLPGWNYLNFQEPLLPGCFVWITEFEKPYPASHPRTNHPNRVQGVTGLIFDLDGDDFSFLSRLTRRPPKAGVFQLGGLACFTRESSPLDGPLPETDFCLSAVILQADTLAAFPENLDGLNRVSLGGKPALHLETPSYSWDVLITS